MTCPVCGGKTKVDETCTDGEQIYRRRVCKECGYIFYTTETESTSDDFYRTMCEIHPRSHKAQNRAWRRIQLAKNER